MGHIELIEKLRALPDDQQSQVLDLIERLSGQPVSARDAGPDQGEWTESGFAAFSLSQALRDMEDDPVVYTVDDLRERWQ